MKILILGSSSFAAQGLVQHLHDKGHEVWTFDRGRSPDAGPYDLNGPYDRLAELVAPIQHCDALINYAIVKHGSEDENLRLADWIIEAARALQAGRFIHISSISVLPAVKGSVDEGARAVAHPWKGVYSKVKVAVERHLENELRGMPLMIVRPGFILGDGLADSMVGIGLRLPTGHTLGLGNRRSIIPLVSRAAVNAALTKLVEMPFSGTQRRFMLVSPDAPTREEYLDFHCRELGRGLFAFHLPVWLWRIGLAFGSLGLTLLKRRRFRLGQRFEHNLNVRHYDCARTIRELGLDLRFDWRETLLRLADVSRASCWPKPAIRASARSSSASNLHYIGLGRIVQQKHLPALVRSGFRGCISWTDPGLNAPPSTRSLHIKLNPGPVANNKYVVVTAPGPAREEIFRNLPAGTTDVLVERPFAVSREQMEQFQSLLRGRRVFVIHNYRFKANVQAFRRFLMERPAGTLQWVTLHYETPSPSLERSPWIRAEWRNRILLTDYALHFLDLAWVLFEGPMTIRRCDTKRNHRGELAVLAADVAFPVGACSLFIRQGAQQRQCILSYVFDNYTVQLRFFPDSFQPIFGGHDSLDDARLFASSITATTQKVLEKLGCHVFDKSHDQLLAAFVGIGDEEALSEFSLQALMPFYERLTELADHVYQEKHSLNSSAIVESNLPSHVISTYNATRPRLQRSAP